MDRLRIGLFVCVVFWTLMPGISTAQEFRVYTLVYDNSTMGDDAAKEKDRMQRTATFTRALQNMKTIAEGGTLPPPAPRGGGAGAPAGAPPSGGRRN